MIHINCSQICENGLITIGILLNYYWYSNISGYQLVTTIINNKYLWVINNDLHKKTTLNSKMLTWIGYSFTDKECNNNFNIPTRYIILKWHIGVQLKF